jgi:hypothetical protein
VKSTYTPEKAKNLFQSYSEKWWIAGGWALDLFLGKQTREHEDLDVAVLRRDEHIFRTHLQNWELWPGFGQGRLEDKPIKASEQLPKDREVLWCRPSVSSEWAFELLLNKSSKDEWIFKRNDNIRMPIVNLNLVNNGIPYLNPEIVLLFKAKNMFDKDEQDFEQVVPRLDSKAREWLGESLEIVHPTHPWLSSL